MLTRRGCRHARVLYSTYTHQAQFPHRWLHACVLVILGTQHSAERHESEHEAGGGEKGGEKGNRGDSEGPKLKGKAVLYGDGRQAVGCGVAANGRESEVSGGPEDRPS